MKYTLLDLVQTVLASIDADEINGINDTVESRQAALLIRSVYMDLAARSNLPEHYGIVNLEPSGDSDKQVLMSIPSDVDKILSIKYDKRTSTDTTSIFQDVCYLPLEDYLSNSMSLNDDATNVDTMEITDGTHTFTLLFTNDQAPQYWTTYNDRSILFDSYDSTVDTTLQSSKTLCVARKIIPWEAVNEFIPDLDDSQFPLLLNESKALAWAELRQSPNQKAEQSARRNWTHLQKSKHNVSKPLYFESLPNFGRK